MAAALSGLNLGSFVSGCLIVSSDTEATVVQLFTQVAALRA